MALSDDEGDGMTTAEDKIKRELETVLDDLIFLAKKYPVLIHTFRYALGAVYALHQAIILEHKDRALYDDSSIQDLFSDLENICIAIKGNGTALTKWEAGFYYNASVNRTDAVNERFLLILLHAAYDNPDLEKKIKLGSGKNNASKLDELAQALTTHLKLNQDINTAPLNAVRKENNRLKHLILGQRVKDAKLRGKKDIETVLDGLKQIVAILKEPWSTSLLDEYFKRHKFNIEH